MFIDNASKFLKEFYKQFAKISLVNMMHDITFGHGQISMLISDKEVFRFYNKNKIPTLCTNEFGRILAPGIYINKIMEEQYQDCAILMPLLIRIGKQFKQNFGKNSLEIVVREQNCQHLYSLYFDLPEKEFLHWVINNGELINDLIANYENNARDLIIEAKELENRIILPSFNSQINRTSSNQAMMSVIHKSLHVPVFLSSQQGQCLKLLMKGKSAKSIAQAMKLSPRTVEHYLERIRRMLGCSTNKELIVHYLEQLNKFLI